MFEAHLAGEDEELLTLERRLVLIAESDLNDPRIVRPTAIGGYGIKAQWSDDFHHALHTVLTGERTGYYADFGSIADLAKTLPAVKASCGAGATLSSACQQAILATNDSMANTLSVVHCFSWGGEAGVTEAVKITLRTKESREKRVNRGLYMVDAILNVSRILA